MTRRGRLRLDRRAFNILPLSDSASAAFGWQQDYLNKTASPRTYMEKGKGLRSQLRAALAECERLGKENTILRRIIRDLPEKATVSFTSHVVETLPPIADPPLPTPSPEVISGDPSPQVKLILFRELFRGRDDVYAVRWQNSQGRHGYSPACRRDGQFFNRHLDPKTSGERDYLPLTDEAIRAHLTGKQIVGIYPLLLDETCWFLAADFDKKSWREDTAAFLETCREMAVPAARERSRSGNGAHVWIFFDRPVRAALARKLGCVLLTRTMERRHQLGLDSYDRLFPSQDTMPKGGFGNLIALPLQRVPRETGNSVFLDEDGQPYPDQWQFLATIKRISEPQVETIVGEAASRGDIVGVRSPVTDERSISEPWMLPPSGLTIDDKITEPLPETVRLVRGNLLYVEKDGLPHAMLDRLIRVAAFQNPEFYKAQAMRLSTFGKPRIISCAEEFPDHIGLPRGCFEEVVELLMAHNIKVDTSDERHVGDPVDMTFRGTLRPLQQMATAAKLAYDDGILCAPTAFGKTAVAAALVAERKASTLVLVHRRHLMDQWRKRLAMFLDVPVEEIGYVGGGKNKRNGRLDVGVIQSLNRKGAVKDWVAEYGHVIVDECHHLSAFSFERVLKQIKAKYVLGLTATPVRKDGHHPIIGMQCGSIRHNLSAKKFATTSVVRHELIPRHTDFTAGHDSSAAGFHEVYSSLVRDDRRNDLIVRDVLRAVAAGRSPLLLTERTEHVERFVGTLKESVPHLFALRGGMNREARQSLAERVRAVPEHEPRVIVATGRYIGEGFDDARLDTLFLTLPISWRGTLQQYVGRIHRLHDGKQVVQVYDYVDAHVPVLLRMYEKRLKGYKAFGYVARDEPSDNQYRLVEETNDRSEQ